MNSGHLFSLRHIFLGLTTAGIGAILLLFLVSPLSISLGNGPVDRFLPIVAHQFPTLSPTPIPGGLVISEVMVDPSGDEPDNEWIELYNPGDFPISISVYKIGDEEQRGGGEGMYRFPAGKTIQPRQVLLIANKASAFQEHFSHKVDYELRSSVDNVPDLLDYSQWSSGNIQLVASGDEVLILGNHDQVVDAVSWGSSAWGFDPPLPQPNEDYSLARWPPGQDTNTAQDWIEQPPDPGLIDTSTPVPTQTPTRTPTQVLPPSIVINEIHADPHPTFGDANGDGAVREAEDEFVELVNSGNQAVDLSGWRLLTGFTLLRHIFPDGTILPAGKALVIFGGGVPQGAFGNSQVQVASTGSLGLIEFGDMIHLVDDQSSLVVEYSYGQEANQDQSITRDPDVMGVIFVLHTQASGAAGTLFSPGTRVDGAPFVP